MQNLTNQPIRTLVLDSAVDNAEVIGNLLRSEPGFTVTTSSVVYGEGARTARRVEPDVVVLVADSLADTDAVLAIEELEGAAPAASVVVLTSHGAERMREFVVAGARDCLAPPYTREALVTSVRRVHQSESRRRERLAANIAGGQRRHRCQVIAFHGAKGGVGTTLLAANVAVALRQLTGERVALVDASLQNGDVGVLMNLTINSGIDDLLPRLNDLDIDLVNRVMGTHESGVRALLAPRELERAEAVGSDEFRRILAFLVGQFDYIVIDTAPVLDAAGLGALDHADQIVLVATPEVPSLKNAGRFLQLARRLGYPSEKIALVVNQAYARNSIPVPQIEQKLGVKVYATVPSAAGSVVYSANHGEVLGGGVGASLTKLARQLAVPTSLKRGKSGFAGLPRLSLPFRKNGAKNANGTVKPRADVPA